MDLQDFEVFAKKYRALTFNDLTVDQKKRLLKRFIHKIEIGVDSVKIHFIVDRDHFERETSFSGSPAIRNSNFLKIVGSNTLTSGAREWT